LGDEGGGARLLVVRPRLRLARAAAVVRLPAARALLFGALTALDARVGGQLFQHALRDGVVREGGSVRLKRRRELRRARVWAALDAEEPTDALEACAPEPERGGRVDARQPEQLGESRACNIGLSARRTHARLVPRAHAHLFRRVHVLLSMFRETKSHVDFLSDITSVPVTDTGTSTDKAAKKRSVSR